MMSNINELLAEAFKLFDEGQVEQSARLYLSCLRQIPNKTCDEYKVALHGLGYVKSELKQFTEARFLYNELHELAILNNDATEQCIAIHQLGMVERMAENYDEASRLFTMEYSLLHQFDIASSLSLATNLYEQGYVQLLQNNIVQAEEYMEKSFHYALLSNDDICIGCSYRGLGEIQKAKGNLEKALRYIELAKESFENANDIIAVKELQRI